jgi:hypothetical protein
LLLEAEAVVAQHLTPELVVVVQADFFRDHH